jgi:hypothetical protein
MRHWLLVPCWAGLALAVGCSSDKRSLQANGKVTYNGTAILKGDITFIPEEKSVAPEAGAIKEGTYSVKLQPGKYRVEIRAVRPTGKKVESATVPGQKEDEVADYIPEEYNTKSRLTADVSSAKTTFDFDLKGPK